MEEKIVITGLGAVTPVGNNVKETWGNICNGVSGLGPITNFDTSDFIVKLACEVKDLDITQYIEAREARRRDRFQQFSAVAVQEAVTHAGLEVSEENAGRIGVVISTGIGGVGSLEENIAKLISDGPRKVSPFLIPMLMANGAAGLAGIDHGFKGPAFSVSSACASGQDGLGMAWLMLKAGMVDVVVAGASEASITPVGVASFDRLGAVSRLEEHAPRPFDKERDGLIIGEGCGIVILEREGHARQRGAEILAELAGYAATADAFHVTAPSENGDGGAKAMRLAMESAKVNPDEVGYISAHGTATQLNDLSETLAIKTAFGQMAYNVPVSSTKSMTGHMMGATGAVEAIFCVQAIREGILPPTINYSTPDPACDLDYIPNEARESAVTVAISNAFGFGGHNTVLTFREYA
ncbi:MAG: beta-ketoacyl-ACP synthase II [Anaerolineae bacterium]|nr:beta-ketoacyl-ACP synthase II [Anaerolineae bacterium]